MWGVVGLTGVGAGGVVVATTVSVGEGVVGVVYLLEFFGSCGTGGVVVGYAVWVVFEGGAEGVSRVGEGWGRGGTVCRRRGFRIGLRWRRLRGSRLGGLELGGGGEVEVGLQ